MTGVRTAARLAAGVVIAGAVAAGVGGGIAFGGPTHTAVSAPVTVAPVAADTVLSCPGPLLALGRDASAAGSISVAAPETVTAVGAGLARAVLPTTGAPGGSGPERLTAPSHGQAAPPAAGAGSATVKAADLSGFAASACTPALMQAWLVGGATSTGSADLVLLANPGTVAATVDLTLYGLSGAQQPPAGNGIVVAPGAQVVVPLAALGLAQDAPVVRVVSSGAPVRASLQSSLVRTLAPGGVDQEAAVAAAAPTQTVTGVRVTHPPQAVATTILRVLAPRESQTALVRVVGADGTVGAPQRVALTAGQPAEVALNGLPVGVYTVQVAAPHPVVAAVWQATGTGDGDDFAWVPAAPVLAAGSAGTPFAVPPGPAPALSVIPVGDTPVHVRLVPERGAATTVTAPAGRTTSLPLSPGMSYRLLPDSAVAAAVTFAGPGAVASYPVWPVEPASAPVVVYR